MNCNDIKNKIYAYIDGCLSNAEVQDFNAHINSCASCKKEYEKTKKIIDDLKECAQNIPDADIDLDEIIYKSNLSLEDNKMKKKRSYFNKNIIKKVASYAAVFFIGVFIYALFMGGSLSGFFAANSTVSDEARDLYTAQSDNSKSESIANDEDTSYSGNESSSTATTNIIDLSSDKIIYNSSMVIEVEDFENAREDLLKIINDNDAFVQNEDKNISTNNNGEYYASYFIIRVPANKFAKVNAQIEKLGKVEHSSSYATNITYEYNDLKSKITQLKTQRSRLLELYNKTDKISELIDIENELTRINSLIESNESIIRNYDRQVQYSTIQVSISEDVSKNSLINPFSGIGQKIKSAFVNSINVFLKLIVYIFIFTVKILPFAIVAAIIYFIVRFILKNKKISKSKEKNTDDSNVDNQ